MAKVWLTYACGHREYHLMPRRQAGRIQVQAASETCRRCRWDAENRAAAAAAQEADLPPLVGRSDRQVLYAEGCRSRVMGRVLAVFDVADMLGTSPVGLSSRAVQLACALGRWELLDGPAPDARGRLEAYLTSIVDAGWWCAAATHETRDVAASVYGAACGRHFGECST